MFCLRCLKENINNEDQCPDCGSQNIIQVQDNQYRYRGQTYTKKGFEKELFKLFVITKDGIKINNSGDYHNQYLKKIFLNNTAKYTFLMLILPWALFLVLSLIILGTCSILYNNGKYGFNNNQTVYIFAAYISLIFLIFSTVLFVQGFILKDKVIMKAYHQRTRMTHISYQKYQETIKLLERESG